MSTRIVPSFVDPTTLQLRIELGSIAQGAITTDIPDTVTFNDSDGYGFAQDTGDLVGRLRGAQGEFFVPIDTLTPSAIQDLFTWSEVDGIRTAPVDDLDRWSVTVNGAPVQVTQISRKANILDTATTGWQQEFTTVHNVFLDLDIPLEEGADLVVAFDDPDFDPIQARYLPQTTISEAIHVNLAGYGPEDGQKLAYLSSWNGFAYDPDHARGGQGVPQIYGAGLGFEVIDEATGAVVLTGETELAQAVDQGTNFWQNYALTDVYQMDLGALTTQGRYHIVVEGVGRSPSFEVEDTTWDALFGLTFRGYYHQRSGIALTEPYTDWERPRALHPQDGITVRQTHVQITETSEAWDGALPKPFDLWEGRLTGDILDDAWGGWHDAGDWDRRTQHLETARKLIELHEIDTGWSENVDGGIPESANALPDLIDEAIWGADVFRRLQKEDGGVPGGIEGTSYGGFGDSSFTDTRDLFVYAPDPWSSWEYAATAAKIARALAPYDPAEAADWLDSATRAFAWAEDNPPDPEAYDNGYYPRARNIAAAELFEATGDPAYDALFAETFVYGTDAPVAWFASQYEAAYAYAKSRQPGADPALQAAALEALRERGDWLLENGTNSGFGFLTDPYAPYGWGNTASQPTYSSEILLRLHALTGNERYLLPAFTDVDYALGANPMNMSFVTGLDRLVPGVRQPEILLDGDTDVLGADPPPGLTLYGEYNVYDYGWNFYHSDMWEDTWPNYYDAPVHESWNGHYSYVPVTEFTVMQGMEDMTFVTGYLAALAHARVSEGWSDTVEDTENAKPWTRITFTYDSAGTVIGRATLYDDGRTSETTYENGARIAKIIRDGADTKPWSDIVRRFDGVTGDQTEETRRFDDGRLHEIAFDAGLRTSAVMTDPEDAKPFLAYVQSFDATGRETTRAIDWDNGNSATVLYGDGLARTRRTEDDADVFAWRTITKVFDAAGALTSKTTLYDTGREVVTQFDEGIRVASRITDTENRFDWAQVTLGFDASGAKLSRTTLYDDGTENTLLF